MSHPTRRRPPNDTAVQRPAREGAKRPTRRSDRNGVFGSGWGIGIGRRSKSSMLDRVSVMTTLSIAETTQSQTSPLRGLSNRSRTSGVRSSSRTSTVTKGSAISPLGATVPGFTGSPPGRATGAAVGLVGRWVTGATHADSPSSATTSAAHPARLGVELDIGPVRSLGKSKYWTRGRAKAKQAFERVVPRSADSLASPPPPAATNSHS